MTGITFCDLLIYVKKIKEKNIWQGCTNNKTNNYERSDPGPLVAPKIGAMLRIRSKWEIYSKNAPNYDILSYKIGAHRIVCFC